MESSYISIKQVLDNVLVHPMLSDVTLERAISYAIDFMKIVGMPSIFMEKTAWQDSLLPENYKIFS